MIISIWAINDTGALIPISWVDTSFTTFFGGTATSVTIGVTRITFSGSSVTDISWWARINTISVVEETFTF